MKTNWLVTLRDRVAALGPYLLIELLLPGGTLLAGLLWLTQRIRRGGTGAPAHEAAQGEPHAAVPPMPADCTCPALPIAAPGAAAVA
jgi:hypothetical protein